MHSGQTARPAIRTGWRAFVICAAGAVSGRGAGCPITTVPW